MGIVYRVLGVDVMKPGATLLPRERFEGILRTSRADTLAIDREGDALHVRHATARYKLATDDADAYPVFGVWPQESDYRVVAASDLKRAIQRASFAVELESTRFALGGLCLDLDGPAGSMTVVATDGRRLAAQRVSIETEGAPSKPATQTIVPAKTCALLDRCLSDDDPPVHFALSGPNVILFRTDRAVIWSRLVEGRFPRWRDVYPEGQPKGVAVIDAGVLRAAMDQASIVTSQESRGITLAFTDGVLTVTASAADAGSAEVFRALAYSGPAIDPSIDPEYAVEMLRSLSPETVVSVELRSVDHAVVFRVGDDYSYILMPLSRDRGRDGD